VNLRSADLNPSNPYSKSDVTIDLMTAGREDDEYVGKVQSIDWNRSYQEHGLGAILEELRDDWKSQYDFVLIDSRTGITDAGGICTVQLPDLLVVTLTANQQSINGTLDISRRIATSRNRMPIMRSKLMILPLPSRFDKRAESSIAQEWLNTFAEQLSALYDDWRPKQVSVPELLNYIRIPYVANWSFGEKLPVVEEYIRDSENIGYSLETLASFIAMKLGQAELLIGNRDNYVAAAQAATAQSLSHAERFKYDVCLSAVSPNDPLVEVLTKGLNSRGLRVYVSTAELRAGDSWVTSLEQALTAAEHLVIIERNELSSFQQHEVTTFLRLVANETSTARRIIPVLATTGQTSGSAFRGGGLQSLLRQFTAIREANTSPSELAALVAQALRAPKASASDDPQKGRFGELPARNGRVLTAIVTSVPSEKAWFRIKLKVRSTEKTKPLAGEVTFFLHPTFRPSEIKKSVRRGECRLTLHAYGAFTVGVEADQGATCLELDLANLPTAPKAFRES
jgi:hypothetical protein